MAFSSVVREVIFITSTSVPTWGKTKFGNENGLSCHESCVINMGRGS